MGRLLVDISINHGVCAHLERESELYCSLGGWGTCHLHRDQKHASGGFPDVRSAL